MDVAAPCLTLRSAVGVATATGLGSAGTLHVLWGRGSVFPFPDRRALADHVIGRAATPSPAACYAVAGLLAVSAVSVGVTALGPSRVARAATIGSALVLGARAGLGFAGRTHLVVPGSRSVAFRRNDRFVYAPICASLALGALYAASGARGPAGPVS